MKRYDFRVKNGVPGLYAVEDGDYYFVPDVTRTMIPRPDAEAAKKAVDEFRESCVSMGFAFGSDDENFYAEQMKKAEAAVLALMGVEG